MSRPKLSAAAHSDTFGGDTIRPERLGVGRGGGGSRGGVGGFEASEAGGARAAALIESACLGSWWFGALVVFLWGSLRQERERAASLVGSVRCCKSLRLWYLSWCGHTKAQNLDKTLLLFFFKFLFIKF